MKIDTRQFEEMVKELSRRLDEPPMEVLREEVGKVLEKTIADTPAMDVGKTRRRFDAARFTAQPETLYEPKYRLRRHPKDNKVLYNLTYRYPSQLWSAITEARTKDFKKKLAARGLAKQSWLKIGEMLGLGVKAPGYVMSAVPTTGKQYSDEDAQIERKAGGINYHFENSQPTVIELNGERILQRAMDGRTLFFVNNLSRAVFDDLAQAAKKYPGVKVTQHG